jgi:YfiH family protein
MSSDKPIATPTDQSAGPQVMTAWDIPGLIHGFGGRTGGVSTGPFASFNLAGWVGDAPDAVAENWSRWHLLHPRVPVVRVRQVHGNLVHRIASSLICSPDDQRHQSDRLALIGPAIVGPDGDGMVTAAAGLALGIFTADCVPLLMVDAERRIVAALHAGWRGTLAGIAAVGVHAMVALGARPASIRAALGPSIGLCCFEVDVALAETFAREIPGAAPHARFTGSLLPEPSTPVTQKRTENYARETPAAHPPPANSPGQSGREDAGLDGAMPDGAAKDDFAHRDATGADAGIDEAMREAAARRDASFEDGARRVRPGKAYLDLRAILRRQLEREGLNPAAISSVGPCTRCANDLYFSRRGAGGVTSGLQMSFIAIAP